MTIIEKGIPFPTRAPRTRENGEKYPAIRQLEVGDSVVIPIQKFAASKHYLIVARELGRRFVSRNIADDNNYIIGCRVWRKE